VTLQPTAKETTMKRLHVHVSVDDLAHSIRFYSALFAVEPTVTKPDYAKWMLDDPRVNFAISARGGQAGLDHLGIQVETQDELGEVYGRLRQADRPILEEGVTTCCYAKSEKTWIKDPQGLSWETFHTLGDSIVYGDSADVAPVRTTSGACCAPELSAPPAAAACCSPKSEIAPAQFSRKHPA
jgi:catechol 2,3-dioxygenase-like lactoylglutathione lyase family enzyme